MRSSGVLRGNAGGAGLVILVLMAAVRPAEARPDYLAKFQADAMRRAESNGCGTCHVKPDGGGARNDFGTAFDAANRDITPLLRASFPQHFSVASVALPDGTTFFMSDPASRVVVVEREKQKVVVNVADLVAPKAAPVPAAATRMTFFVSSRAVDQGGRLGGLAGADRFCQDLAKAAGASDRTWRAYLSTSYKGQPAVNAGDRIGSGPWHNAAGELVARGPLDLHHRTRLAESVFRTERGEAVAAGTVVLTGTTPSGLAAIDQACANWTGSGEGAAAAGRVGAGWNGSDTASCAPASMDSAPRLYCFALP